MLAFCAAPVRTEAPHPCAFFPYLLSVRMENRKGPCRIVVSVCLWKSTSQKNLFVRMGLDFVYLYIKGPAKEL